MCRTSPDRLSREFMLCVVKYFAGAGHLTITRATIAGAAAVTALAILAFALVVRDPALEQDVEPAATRPLETAADVHPGVLYGRINTVDGATYEGRLRWGGDQEAFWGDYFNGTRDANPWAVHASLEHPATEPFKIEIFGFRIGGRDRSIPRLFMARFGDIARIEAHFGDVQVTLKSGTVFKLDRFAAGDIDDGVRVWDSARGVVDLDARRIRTIEFLPTTSVVAISDRLRGTVRTRQGDFTGFIQWDQQDGVGADELKSRTADGALSLRYDTIRSIARQSRDTALVTLLDGREMVLSDSREIGDGNRGIYVDDGRYGRVLISWDAFERVEFSAGGSGPAYTDFPPGRRLAGSVTTRAGRRLTGRLVYDLDESETTETFDSSSQGVDYNIPFGLIAAIVPRGRDERGIERARVTLRDGEELSLERKGDLGDGNAGMLIFVDARERPDYVPWTDVERIDFDRAPAMDPPLDGRSIVQDVADPRSAKADHTSR